MYNMLLLALLFNILMADIAFSYTNQEICDSIFIIEGKYEANQLYGINPKYLKCSDKESCEKICLNTVRNNRERFKNQTKEVDFLTFLAKRYCPPNWKVWLKNLKFYLNKEKK